MNNHSLIWAALCLLPGSALADLQIGSTRIHFASESEGQETLTANDDFIRRLGPFEEQVGENTSYIIHPEEILADNFALLVLKTKDVPSPEILRKMRNVLTQGQDR